MNLTLSVKEDVLKKARAAARARGTSVNQLVREFLESLGGLGEPEREIDEFRRLSESAGGRSRGWEFDRDEIHGRT